MLWHAGRLHSCGCRKTRKVICGMEEENVVANGHLPFPARCRWTRQNISFLPPPLYHNTTIQPPLPLSVQTNVCPCRYIVSHVFGPVVSVREEPRSIKHDGEGTTRPALPLIFKCVFYFTMSNKTDIKIRLYCQYLCMSENVFVWRYSAYFFPCVMCTKYMYAVFVNKIVRESIFRIQIEYRLQSMHNHMEGRTGSILSPLYFYTPWKERAGAGAGWIQITLHSAQLMMHCTVNLKVPAF